MLCMLSVAQLMQTNPHVRLSLVGRRRHHTRGLNTSEGDPANGGFHLGRVFESLIEPGADVLL